MALKSWNIYPVFVVAVLHVQSDVSGKEEAEQDALQSLY